MEPDLACVGVVVLYRPKVGEWRWWDGGGKVSEAWIWACDLVGVDLMKRSVSRTYAVCEVRHLRPGAQAPHGAEKLTNVPVTRAD